MLLLSRSYSISVQYVSGAVEYSGYPTRAHTEIEHLTSSSRCGLGRRRFDRRGSANALPPPAQENCLEN